MNNRNDNHSAEDKRLDDLLKKHVAKPSASFTANTIARIRAEAEVSDEFVDRMLAKRPVVPSADFTARTLARVDRKETILTYLRPAMAAAASVAISLSGIWVYESASIEEPLTGTVVASETTDMQEIRELADALREAEPLLNPKATETIASVYGE